MFCFKCGRPIEVADKYCPYCGVPQFSDTAALPDTVQVSEVSESTKKDTWNGMSAVDILICIMYALMILRWTRVFLTNIKSTWNYFKFIDKDTGFIGMLVYTAVFAILIFTCVMGINSVKHHVYHISMGFIIIGFAVLIKTGMLIFDGTLFDSTQMIAYQIVYVYGKITVGTIVLGILISFLLYTKIDKKV